MLAPRPKTCDRIRGWISSELDGELSDFESVLLRAHLDDCESCRAFQAGARSFTQTLRNAPLEQMERPAYVPRRRRHAMLQPLRVSGAAALVATAVALSGLVATFHGGSPISRAERQPAVTTTFDDSSLRSLRLARETRALNELHLRRAQLGTTAVVRHPGFQP
jgi:predicted anti-sigma-YlaC factor YlaD